MSIPGEAALQSRNGGDVSDDEKGAGIKGASGIPGDQASCNSDSPCLLWTECLGPFPVYTLKPKPPM